MALPTHSLLRGGFCAEWMIALGMGVYYAMTDQFHLALGCLGVFVVGALAHSSLISEALENWDE
jgi:hypothetical protein